MPLQLPSKPKADAKRKRKGNKSGVHKVNTLAKQPTITSWTFLIPLVLWSVSAYAGHGRIKPALPWPTPADNKPRLLASTQSITGRISVIDYPYKGRNYLRALRADHSLLGGIWIGYARQQVLQHFQSQHVIKTQAEMEAIAVSNAPSIYATFYLQEAVRLVNREHTQPSNEAALVIGLGIGVSARDLIRHAINTTIVEIDPAVYHYARDYFALPAPQQVYLKDARSYLASDATPASFDYVVHDVFSGGSLPSALFTQETWMDIKAVLKPQGVLAVNFAGMLQSRACSIVLKTLTSAFKTCRAYEEDVSQDPTSVKNMVIFCTDMPVLTFRTDVKAPHHDLFQNLDDHQVDMQNLFDSEAPYLLDRNASKLDDWQKPSAKAHWHILRSEFDNDFWTLF